jgi:hypothetical protein
LIRFSTHAGSTPAPITAAVAFFAVTAILLCALAVVLAAPARY